MNSQTRSEYCRH